MTRPTGVGRDCHLVAGGKSDGAQILGRIRTAKLGFGPGRDPTRSWPSRLGRLDQQPSVPRDMPRDSVLQCDDFFLYWDEVVSMPGRPTCYTITQDGTVWNNDTMHAIRPYLQSRGYHQVELYGKKHLVHRLVAEAFIPNAESKPTVDHIDRDKTNNHISNLRWATYSEQMHNTIRSNRVLQSTTHTEVL